MVAKSNSFTAHRNGLPTAREKQKFEARLEEFRGLEFNWDSYGADPVSDATLDFSKKVGFKLMDAGIEIDFAVPMRDGGVQLEFRRQGRECELEVHPSGELTFLIYNENKDILEKRQLKMERMETIF